MDQESQPGPIEPTPGGETQALPSAARPVMPSAAPSAYQGNKYDVYALTAGTLGGTALALCFSGNFLLYCLPVVPLVLGIVALRNARSAVDPQRTRNLAWLGIAGGGLGTLLTLFMILLIILYFGFIFAVIMASLQSVPRR